MICPWLNLIVAMTEHKEGIGLYNGLPWPRISEDMLRFQKLTSHSPVIMGHKTFESLGKPLWDRLNIILTRKVEKTYIEPSRLVTFTDSKNYAIALSRINQELYSEKAWVIGGQDIYQEFLPHVARLYITLVKQKFYCDRFFPQIDKTIWQLESSEQSKTQEIPIEFQIWSRK